MTKDDWLTVAMIMAVIITAAATLLGPVLAVIVQLRASQPRPKPSANQPRNLDQSLHRQVWGSRWGVIFGGVMFIANLALFFVFMRRLKTDFAPFSILLMVASVGAGYCYVAMLFALTLAGRLAKAIDELRRELQKDPPSDQ